MQIHVIILVPITWFEEQHPNNDVSGFALKLPVTTKAKKNTFVRKVCSVILSPVIFITFITVCD